LPHARECLLFLALTLAYALALAALTPPVRAETVRPVERNRLFFIGGAGDTRLSGALALDGGDLLLAGSTDSLDWLPADLPRQRLVPPVGDTRIGGGERIAFLLRVSPDLRTLRLLHHFAPGAVDEIGRLRATGAPGGPVGEIYASGRYPKLAGEADGFWLTRLPTLAEPSASAIGPVPDATLPWLHFVPAPALRKGPNGAPGEGDLARRQPWDVRSDGRVIYAEGTPHSTGWAALRVLERDGTLGALPGWIIENGQSFLALKPGRKGSLRSTTQADFEHRQPDENDHPGRKGRYPDDYYFSAFDSGRGPGYTGYRAVGSTQRVSQLAVDRRDNSLYFGTSTQTRLPDGNPDFEPAFIRLDADGRLVWWARGYREVERVGDKADAHQDGLNSPPDQYVDHVAIDYAGDRVFFLARAHGGGVINYWNGDKIVRAEGRPGFQNNLQDTGNVHVSWLGAYTLADGKVLRSTWLAELGDGTHNLGPIYPAGPMSGWPRPNQGWTRQNTTRVEALDVDHEGRPAVLAIGRRPYTTRYALIENVKPAEGRSAWAPFARLYDHELRRLDYSTLLRGPWDPATGAGGEDKTEPRHLLAVPGGLLVVGQHLAAPPEKASLPPAGLNAPAWGHATPRGGPASGLVVLLRIDDEDQADVAPADMGARPRSRY
jgi:hypothetical protein